MFTGPMDPGVNSHLSERAPGKSLPGNFHARQPITAVNLLHLSLSLPLVYIFFLSSCSKNANFDKPLPQRTARLKWEYSGVALVHRPKSAQITHDRGAQHVPRQATGSPGTLQSALAGASQPPARPGVPQQQAAPAPQPHAQHPSTGQGGCTGAERMSLHTRVHMCGHLLQGGVRHPPARRGRCCVSAPLLASLLQ